MELRTEGIRKDFIRKGNGTNVYTAVQPADLLLRAGTITGIRGRSGSGKSTLLNMLAGILCPTQGKVFYDDADLYAMEDRVLSGYRNSHIGYIPQGSSAISSLTIRENVLLPGMLKKSTVAEAELEKEAERLMQQLGILHLAGEKPQHLSGGELKRMSVARAMLLKPEVLLADEPTGDLDDENTEVFFRLMREYAGDGHIVLIVTHEENIRTHADQLYRMDAGRLTEEQQ
ncbi:MAG: ATP-binding cassette domain-containing protein [Lachnospiraceae bacterium]|nr:ATP-binding cassette domain-containing protein [Lachnospiraceae bacterium]